jgi:hypothetical protein
MKSGRVFVILSAAKNPLGHSHRFLAGEAPVGFFAALRMTEQFAEKPA